MSEGENRAADGSTGEASTPPADVQPTQSFPREAVVGVLTSSDALERVRSELQEAGFEPHLLAGERGLAIIEAAGQSTAGLRLTRAVQGMFGFEVEHTERHQAELENGNFIVLVESHDDPTTERISRILAANGAIFTHYYSRWTSRRLDA